MRIVVLNGSPKGNVSVTMQYIAYIRKKFPEPGCEIFNVAQDIRDLEKDPAALDAVIGSIRSADLVLFAFPLYYLLVCAQYKRFIELVFERNYTDAFAGRYAASLSTSIHFFDQTAHAYIHGISDDLGMKFLGSYSAEMRDLLDADERVRLEKFATLLISDVQEKVFVQRENPPVTQSGFSYVTGPVQKTVNTGTNKVVILTDDNGRNRNLATMTGRLEMVFSGSAEVINLHDLDIRGGCLGCCQCGYDNTCVYSDGYVDFFKNTLATADIIIMAGSVHDRYLSSAWKQFFDRSFFKGHTPGLEGRQIGFVIAGPLGQIPVLKEALSAWGDNGGCHLHFVTDEVEVSGELDSLIDSFAGRLVACAGHRYIPPHTFYAVGGHKIFRDSIFGRMRFVFQADYRYYVAHGMFDFPQADIGTRLMNAIFIPLTRIPAFRKKVFTGIRHHMVEPFQPVLKNA